MKNTTRLLIVGYSILFGGLLTSCDSKPDKVPQNIYEEAVYSSSRFNGDDEQDKGRKPALVLEFSTVSAGMTVADLSAGTGYYTELLSHVVGKDGTVYLHNKPSYVAREDKKAAIDERMKNKRLANVSLVASEFSDLSLPGKVDMVFVSKIFHDFYLSKDEQINNRVSDEFFREINRYLNDAGLVLLIDHAAPKDSKTTHTAENHRIDENFVKQVFEAHGFSLLSSSRVLRNDADDRTQNIWDGSVFKKTDRFVYLFRKK